MIRLTHESVIRLGVAPADFRCGIDGFAARCRTLLGEEPSGGTLYVFINRARTMIRCLAHDGTGVLADDQTALARPLHRLADDGRGGDDPGERPGAARAARERLVAGRG